MVKALSVKSLLSQETNIIMNVASLKPKYNTKEPTIRVKPSEIQKNQSSQNHPNEAPHEIMAK